MQINRLGYGGKKHFKKNNKCFGNFKKCNIFVILK